MVAIQETIVWLRVQKSFQSPRWMCGLSEQRAISIRLINKKRRQKKEKDVSNELIDSLEVLTQTNGHLENLDDPVRMQTGKFYNFKLSFSSQVTFPHGVSFELLLEDKSLSGSYKKVIDYGRIEDLNTTGDNSLSIDTIIPTDVPDGEYVMIINPLDERLEVDDRNLDSTNIKQTAQIGSLALSIYNDTDSKRIEIVDVIDDGYIDLSKSMDFVDGYTEDPIGSMRFVNYNSSTSEHNITVSATLELENGTSFDLGILDISKETVLDSTSETIHVHNPDEIGVGAITLDYYVKESDYGRLLALVPDLSEDNSTDGLKGTIKWSITTQDKDIVLNNPQTKVLLSEFDDNFIYNKEEIPKEARKYRSDPELPIYCITYNNTKGNSIVQKWQPTRGNIKNLSFSKIDAALDYSSSAGYIFSGNKYVKYYKKNNSVSDVRSISKYWDGVNFDKIVAAVKHKDKIFFFSKDQYIRYDIDDDEADSGYPKKIRGNWPGLLGNGETLRAALTYDGNTIYFVVGNKYKAYDFNKDQVISIRDFTDKSWKNLSQGFDAGMTYGDKVIFFSNSEIALDRLNFAKKLWSQGILFKVDKDYKKVFGSAKKASVNFNLNYGTLGNWKELYVRAYGNSALTTSLFGTKNTIFGIESEAQAGVKAKYKSSNDTKSRIGAKLKIEVMNNTWYEKDTITEETKTKTISDNNATGKKKAVEESKEASKGKGFSLPNKEWKEERILFTKSFVAGVIPLTIAGGVDGKLTLKSDFELEGIGAYLTGSVAGDINGFVEGGLDFSIIKVMLKAKSTFGDVEVKGKVGAKLDIDDNDKIYFGLGTNVDTTIKLLNIQLKAEAKIGYKMLSKRGTINIWDSPWAFDESYKLLDSERPLISIPSDGILK